MEFMSESDYFIYFIYFICLFYFMFNLKQNYVVFSS